jgi:hypothetical protein
MTSTKNCKTFTRSATNFEDFARAMKRTVDRNLTEDEARRACANFNDHRTPAQIRHGTKMEYTRQ